MSYILIVDDDGTTRSCVARMLHDHGLVTRQARDGEEAVRHYEAERAAMVLLDIIMPALDGFETLRRLRAIDPKVKVLGMSAGSRFSGNGLLAMARQLGMQVTLHKPFTKDELMAHVRGLLEDGISPSAPGPSRAA